MGQDKASGQGHISIVLNIQTGLFQSEVLVLYINQYKQISYFFTPFNTLFFTYTCITVLTKPYSNSATIFP